MKNIYHIRPIITSFVGSCILGYFLFTVKGFFSKIIVLLFLIFSVTLLLSKIFLLLNKKDLARKLSKIYTIAFLTYWFGFLIYWDYVSILNGNYIALLISLIFWIAGLYVAYKRLKQDTSNK